MLLLQATNCKRYRPTAYLIAAIAITLRILEAFSSAIFVVVARRAVTLHLQTQSAELLVIPPPTVVAGGIIFYC